MFKVITAGDAMFVFKRLLKDESGTSAIEYGFIAAFIVIGIVAGLTTIGGQVAKPFTTVSSNLSR